MSFPCSNRSQTTFQNFLSVLLSIGGWSGYRFGPNIVLAPASIAMPPKPSSIRSHPISCWSANSGCLVGNGDGAMGLLYHPQWPWMIVAPKPGAVPCSTIHIDNSVSAVLHLAFEDRSGHLMTCNLSSGVPWQCGQWADVQSIQCTMFCPCEKMT